MLYGELANCEVPIEPPKGYHMQNRFPSLKPGV